MGAPSSQLEDMLKKVEAASLTLPFDPFDFVNINNMKVTIKIKKPKNSEIVKERKTILIDGETLGRSKDKNSIPLDDSTISREHAKIFFLNDNFWIRDVGSSSGTYIKLEKN
jgi:pSer/pThr/pTyr-binding forkhead associated (FHA) protein